MRSPLSNWFISTRKPKDNQALAYLPIWGELSLFPIMENKKGYRISQHQFSLYREVLTLSFYPSSSERWRGSPLVLHII
jgi:hypothetical protein